MDISSVWQKIKFEASQPALLWGLRLAVCLAGPLVYGIYLSSDKQFFFMALAAQSLALIEMKGPLGLRIRLLLIGVVLIQIFCVLGSLAGHILIIHLALMFAVAYFSSLFKNLGERGMGLALGIYLFYIISAAYPVRELSSIGHRLQLAGLGCGWTFLVTLASFALTRRGQHYRRSIADIWLALSQLADTALEGWDGRNVRASERNIYLKEKGVREQINVSMALFRKTTHEVAVEDKLGQKLAMQRKNAALYFQHLVQLISATQEIKQWKEEPELRQEVYALLRVAQQLGELMHQLLLFDKSQDRQLLQTRCNRLISLLGVAKDLKIVQVVNVNPAATIVNAADELLLVLQNSLEQNEAYEGKTLSVYSFQQSMRILHPRYFKEPWRDLMIGDVTIKRYALRVAVAATIGLMIAHFLFPDHGYWIPFTVILVSQPYFGATLQKGLERTAGTMAGILFGAGLLYFNIGHTVMMIIIILSSVLLMYYLKKSYRTASFFVTLSLVCLLALTDRFSDGLLLYRLACTLIGSALAIMAGFILLPSWDATELPSFLIRAIEENRRYFQLSFTKKDISWLQLKRNAESANFAAYDSFFRFLKEPGTKRQKQDYGNYLSQIMHSIRITHELSNLHSSGSLEWGEGDKKCIEILENSVSLWEELLPEVDSNVCTAERPTLTSQQQLLLQKMNLELKALIADKNSEIKNLDTHIDSK